LYEIAIRENANDLYRHQRVMTETREFDGVRSTRTADIYGRPM